MLYPKINSLYKREGCGPFDEKQKRYVADLEKKPRKSPLIMGEYAREEFDAIKYWTVTEKIDGTNVRILYNVNEKGEASVEIGGRTDNAQFPLHLLKPLQELFTVEKMQKQFPGVSRAILFGEGYGAKIQSGGYYRKDNSFIMFDAWCGGFWLTRESVARLAESMGIDYCKPLKNHKDGSEFWTKEQIVEHITFRPDSYISEEKHVCEGIVARSHPQMLFRDKDPIMFKLKVKDFYGND